MWVVEWGGYEDYASRLFHTGTCYTANMTWIKTLDIVFMSELHVIQKKWL